jgi:hypothetical protein
MLAKDTLPEVPEQNFRFEKRTTSFYRVLGDVVAAEGSDVRYAKLTRNINVLLH